MNERELVRHVLANLPRPTPPPQIRQRVLAAVQAETAATRIQVWVQEQDGRRVVRRREQGTAALPSPASPAVRGHAFTYHTRRQENGLTVYRTY